MDASAYRQYELESENWLKSGRKKLLEGQLRRATQGRRDLEILDLGAGVGQNVPVLQALGSVDVLEMNEIGLAALRTLAGVREIFDQPIPFELDRTYDVIVATDVLEHIADDRAAVEWISAHLKPGGVFVSTVPAYQFLFSEHDVALHHFRRYTAGNYGGLMTPYLNVERCGYFNSFLFPVAATMRLVNRLRPKTASSSSPQKQSSVVAAPIDKVFRTILDVEVKMIEARMGLPFGLSVYCVARRGGEAA